MIMIIDIVGTWCIGIPLCLLAAYVFSLVCADLLLAVQTVGYLAAWIQLHVRRTQKPGTAYDAVPGFYETRDEIISILLFLFYYL